ncbi:hypothetical protein [Xenorhabdus sp. IM139775]|uniref:hypothetical protein n=1 Tax=Xenorhabdus sp. IM139775 TaxID=3025876 RepID=UPI002359AB20|nr:hypothetical protein [Xenorhabdus sp. IM139775]MDC9594769.1 hypothetical protein [Xenorhabdus sp. IM139775]
MNILSYIESLGAGLNAEWESIDFSISAFPELAHNTILNKRPEDVIDIYQLTEDLLQYTAIPKQRFNHGSQFGQPPFTLYVSPGQRFFIEMYLWSSVDMTIHDHPFSGAFSIFEGVCKHETFTFERTGGYDTLQTGILKSETNELLSRGDSRTILNGSRLIHRNLHLSRPTVTFIIRTYRDPGFTGMLFEESGLGIVPDLGVSESKYLDYLDGFIQLHNYSHAIKMIKLLMNSNVSPYAKFRAIEMYLEDTRHYHEIDMLADTFCSANLLIPFRILKDSFELRKNAIC